MGTINIIINFATKCSLEQCILCPYLNCFILELIPSVRWITISTGSISEWRIPSTCNVHYGIYPPATMQFSWKFGWPNRLFTSIAENIRKIVSFILYGKWSWINRKIPRPFYRTSWIRMRETWMLQVTKCGRQGFTVTLTLRISFFHLLGLSPPVESITHCATVFWKLSYGAQPNGETWMQSRLAFLLRMSQMFLQIHWRYFARRLFFLLSFIWRILSKSFLILFQLAWLCKESKNRRLQYHIVHPYALATNLVSDRGKLI